MATVSINDLKIRVLQLKSLGYDKLLQQQSLNEQLNKVARDLTAISDEVSSLMVMITTAEEQLTQQPPDQNIPPTPPSGSSDNSPPPSSPDQFIKVDQTKLGEILSPVSNKDKQKKTEHNIGRRVS